MFLTSLFDFGKALRTNAVAVLFEDGVLSRIASDNNDDDKRIFVTDNKGIYDAIVDAFDMIEK